MEPSNDLQDDEGLDEGLAAAAAFNLEARRFFRWVELRQEFLRMEAAGQASVEWVAEWAERMSDLGNMK